MLTQILQDTDQGALKLDWRDMAKMLYALDAKDRGHLITTMDPLHPADIADLSEQINPFIRSSVIWLYDREFDGEILTEPQEGLREEIIVLRKPDVLADAVLMGTVGLIWFNSSILGYAIALALVINFMTAGLAGSGEPVILERLSIDLALASNAFLTTVTDMVGFLAFFGLAAWMLF